MNTWDFLIQREDEGTWSSLAEVSPLKVGNYRLMAQTSKANQAIDICLVYCESNLVAKKKQKYSRYTDAEGLLILPLTQLGTGNWEICCRPDLMGELFGEKWQQKISLKVGSKRELEQPKSLDLSELISWRNINLKEEFVDTISQPNLTELEIYPEEEKPQLVEFNFSNLEQFEPIVIEDFQDFKDHKHQSLQDLEIADIEFNWSNLEQFEPIVMQSLEDFNDHNSEVIQAVEVMNNTLNHQTEEINKEEFVVAEIVAIAEESSLVPSPFRSTNYVIELSYLDYASSITFDIEVVEPKHQPSRALDLPNPAKMNKYLYKNFGLRQEILPPKLYPHRSSFKARKSIQLAKFEKQSLSV